MKQNTTLILLVLVFALLSSTFTGAAITESQDASLLRGNSNKLKTIQAQEAKAELEVTKLKNNVSEMVGGEESDTEEADQEEDTDKNEDMDSSETPGTSVDVKKDADVAEDEDVTEDSDETATGNGAATGEDDDATEDDDSGEAATDAEKAATGEDDDADDDDDSDEAATDAEEAATGEDEDADDDSEEAATGDAGEQEDSDENKDENEDENEDENDGDRMQAALEYDAGDNEMIAINMTTEMSALQAEIDRLQSQKTVVAKLIELLTNDASTFRTMLHDGDRHQLNALEDEITKLRSEAAQGMVSHEHEMTDMEQKLKVRTKKKLADFV